jgi:hypothetical protein
LADFILHLAQISGAQREPLQTVSILMTPAAAG